MGVDAGFVQKAGAWFSYNDAKLGQGKENSRSYLKENPEVAQEIEDKIRAKYGMTENVVAAPEEE
jgi:recombination protein RecA